MQLHRLVRNSHGRALYDRLRAAGITATWLSEYVRQLDGTQPVAFDTPYRITPCVPERVASLGAPVEDLLDNETVIGAFSGTSPLGYLFLSVNDTVDIGPIERPVSFDGAYIRRVYVAPRYRQEGVASGLLTAAREEAADSGADRALALVARDNRPSRHLFESHAFTVVREHRYVRVGPVSYYSTTDTGSDEQ